MLYPTVNRSLAELTDFTTRPRLTVSIPSLPVTDLRQTCRVVSLHSEFDRLVVVDLSHMFCSLAAVCPCQRPATRHTPPPCVPVRYTSVLVAKQDKVLLLFLCLRSEVTLAAIVSLVPDVIFVIFLQSVICWIIKSAYQRKHRTSCSLGLAW